MTGDLHLMQPLMAPLTTIPMVILLGLDPMVTADITATQHKMVMWTLVQTLAAGVLLIGCHQHHHSLVLRVTNTIKRLTNIDHLIFSFHFWWGRPRSPISGFLVNLEIYTIRIFRRGESERHSEGGREEGVYIEDYSSSISCSHGLARCHMMDSRFTWNPIIYSIQFFSILIKFYFSFFIFSNHFWMLECICLYWFWFHVYFPSLMAL